MPNNIKQIAENVLRSYLVRCFSDVSKQYAEVSEMSPEDGVDILLKLKNENKINIELDTVGDFIKCTIQRLN
ncbi:MAG: hypothetical protein QNL62_06250 [Gammaproteobacteria bacterium]|nr:hypothetical protein [Gammaproteobacteria bacterium]